MKTETRGGIFRSPTDKRTVFASVATKPLALAKEPKPLSKKKREELHYGPAPQQQDLVSPLAEFFVLSAKERRLDDHYTRTAEKIIKIRQQYPFNWRDAERMAVAHELDKRFGLKDAAFQVLSEQAGESSAVAALFAVAPMLSAEEQAHADRIVSRHDALNNGPLLAAATLRGQAEIEIALYVGAKTAAQIAAGGDE